ncbi:BRCT domain-containing protein [Vagococcus fluvialis]|uniref:BRCT domain-containing protein n=1 Tax=Vagococcus fluvialis TaxID=2738 RepID=A0A7X6I4I4_9ENTE|nr:BRCT domain-containing protein [Vagococcus fluvialis]NKC69084.1 hypothetical protein [Vagococcus fluvialis]
MKISKGSHIAITGRFQSFNRDVGIFLIETLGFHYQPFVSLKTDVLVKGYFSVDLFDETKESKKLNSAKENGVLIINEMTFLLWVIQELKNFTGEQKSHFCESYYDEIQQVLNLSEAGQQNKMVDLLINQLEKKITIV